MTSQLLRHQDLFSRIDRAPPVRQKALINTLHYVHFTNSTVFVHASDRKYEEKFLLRARLDACSHDGMVYRWEESTPADPKMLNISHVAVSDGLSLIILPIQLKALIDNGFKTVMPEGGYLLGIRGIRRHECRGISVGLIQNGFQARGELIDFTPQALRVRLFDEGNISVRWFNKESPCMIHLQEQEQILFSGPCRFVRESDHLNEKELVVAPLEQAIQRFQKRKIRNRRMKLKPQPTARFNHPLFEKPVQRDIYNLTVAGFAVQEPLAESVLMPGLIIPAVEIRLAGMVKLTCDAQVIYRRPAGKNCVCCGLAITDMDFTTYTRLSHVLAHAEDPKASFASDVEMESLFEFFFDTGFIYPKKYHLLQPSREAFKETYQHLYHGHPEIATHFTYEENGRIYGHVSMIRAYQRAWMIHHLAARPLNRRRTGLSILKNILGFSEGLFRFPSIQMSHMFFYFRPENRFPNFFFGTFTRDLGNPRACSLDLFAYLTCPINIPTDPFPQDWQLRRFQTPDLPALERYYRNASGGLLMDILPIKSLNSIDEPLDDVYRRNGFLRQTHIHSLVCGEKLKAVLIVNRSSLGMNLSELINGIKIIVIDGADMPWDIMKTALAELTPSYPAGTVPLLIYPDDYPEQQGVQVEKRYLLWIMATEYGRTLREYLEKKTRLTLRFIFGHLIRKLVSK
jgi:hypothetical protein